MIEKIDSANIAIKDKIDCSIVDLKRNKIAQNLAKNLKIDGFRKGKVPLKVVESRHKEQITQEAQNEALNDCIQKHLKDANIAQNSVIGSAIFDKFEVADGNIEFEAKLGLLPEINLADLKKSIPQINLKKIDKKAVDERLAIFAKNSGELIEVDKNAESGDIANIDFEGFIDGSAFEGGSAKGFDLELGSKSFIDGFESGLLGAKKGDEKTLNLEFPKDYAEHLAGKKCEFKVKINAIKKRDSAPIDDDLAKKVLSNNAEAKLEDLEAFIKTQLESEAKSTAFNEAKPALVENLLKDFTFDLPQNIIEQEMDIVFRNALHKLNEGELKELQENKQKAKEKRETHRAEAEKSVRLTFIVDTYAKANNIKVADGELYQMLYYEAMMSGQNPKDLADSYEKSGMFPAIKMTILENKVLNHILDSADLAKKADSAKSAKNAESSAESRTKIAESTANAESK
ncbi:trigger factor [Helicobacter sp. 23-1044]